jgi:hypothetical protein
MSLEEVLALAVALLCAGWLARRAFRSLSARRGGCGCGKPTEAPCSQASAVVEAARAGARRRAGTAPRD